MASELEYACVFIICEVGTERRQGLKDTYVEKKGEKKKDRVQDVHCEKEIRSFDENAFSIHRRGMKKKKNFLERSPA